MYKGMSASHYFYMKVEWQDYIRVPEQSSVIGELESC